MDWSARMNAAIDYIEENLVDEIDFTKTAEKASCSAIHFHRMFFAVNCITPVEYTRRRRLTLAARELTSGNAKVIDIAMKYGYDSPDAFTRAFRNLHGITPTAARKPGVKLTSYPRISFHIELKGGSDMDYKIVEKPAFDLLGISRRYGVADGEIYREASKFWGEWVVTEEYQRLWALTEWKLGPVTEAPIMSAYLPNENDTWDPIVNAMGIEKTDNMETKGFKVFHIPAATYAEFNCTLDTSTETNKRIYSEWFPSTGYERDHKADVEAYFQMPLSPRIYARWWIPIVKKR